MMWELAALLDFAIRMQKWVLQGWGVWDKGEQYNTIQIVIQNLTAFYDNLPKVPNQITGLETNQQMLSLFVISLLFGKSFKAWILCMSPFEIFHVSYTALNTSHILIWRWSLTFFSSFSLDHWHVNNGKMVLCQNPFRFLLRILSLKIS